MSLKGMECQVSQLFNSDTCPRPTTDQHRLRLERALDFELVQPERHVLDVGEHLAFGRTVVSETEALATFANPV